MKRIFIVGTARSGTTLLQSIVANHPAIFSLPETHFFPYSIPKNKALRLFHKVKPAQIKRINQLLAEIGYDQNFKPTEKDLKNLNRWTDYLLRFLDHEAESKNCEAWLEKTPMHLHYIDLIKKNCHDCLFIHTIREPKANIAALYDVSKKHPEAFKQASLEKSIKRYKAELKLSEKYYKLPNHLHVYYEELVQNPEQVSKTVLDFLKLPKHDLVNSFQENAQQLISKEESWKANNSGDLELQDKLKKRLSSTELGDLEAALKSFKSPLLLPYEDFTA